MKGLAKHIRETQRAFPLADLAKMILNGRDRYQVCFESTEDGGSLFQCKDDGSLWLSREEAMKHILSSKILDAYYDVEEVDIGAPPGNFSVIAVCGMSGEILGPPNHHEYQRNVAKLHAEKFSNMPLETFKARIVMENGEEIIERWKEKVSKRKQYRLKSEEKAEVTEEVIEETPAAEEPADAEAVAETAPPTEEAEVSSEEAAASAEEEAAGEENLAEEAAAPEVEESTEPAEEGESSLVEEEPAPEAEEKEEAILKSPEELARHFKEHFAEAALVEAKRAVVRGDVQGRDLARGLLVHLKQESEKLRRGFPLPMIQALCRDFEKEGLRFFKRGKKALHVSAIRPKAIGESVSLTASIQAIIDQILKTPGIRVANLLAELADDFAKPEKDQAPETLELTDKAKSVLKDLRWLTSEGFVIEFPDSKLALGKQPQAPAKKAAPKKEAPAAAATAVATATTAVAEAKPETEVPVEEPVAVEEPVVAEVAVEVPAEKTPAAAEVVEEAVAEPTPAEEPVVAETPAEEPVAEDAPVEEDSSEPEKPTE